MLLYWNDRYALICSSNHFRTFEILTLKSSVKEGGDSSRQFVVVELKIVNGGGVHDIVNEIS